MPVIERDAVLQAVRSALEPLPYVIAMWEGGSVAWGRSDEWSDIDLQILVEDERSTDTFALVERALESLSPIELRFEVPQPTWHGHEQVFYRLRDGGEYRIVDVAVMRRSSRHQLRERERHGNRVIFFDKTGEGAPTTLDQEEHKLRLARSVERLRVSFPLFQHLTKKELLRGNPSGALAFYYSHTLQPLLTLLRIRHCPDRFDFGPRYSRVDLPSNVVDTLESLWFVSTPAELEAKRRRAEECFYATMDEITSAQSLTLPSNTKQDVQAEKRENTKERTALPSGDGHLQGHPELTRYARVRRAGPLLFLAGISSRQSDNSIKGAGSNRTGALILDVRAQTEGAIENLRRTLEEHGASLDDVVDLTVFLTRMSDYRAFNEVYNRFFATSLPARTTVCVQQLPDLALCIELKAIAYRPKPEPASA